MAQLEENLDIITAGRKGELCCYLFVVFFNLFVCSFVRSFVRLFVCLLGFCYFLFFVVFFLWGGGGRGVLVCVSCSLV